MDPVLLKLVTNMVTIYCLSETVLVFICILQHLTIPPLTLKCHSIDNKLYEPFHKSLRYEKMEVFYKITACALQKKCQKRKLKSHDTDFRLNHEQEKNHYKKSL